MAVISASDIVQFAAREGNDFIRNQINTKAPLFAALDKMPMKGKRAIINVAAGGIGSTTMVNDFGALPSEDAATPKQGTVDAVGYVATLGLGRIALATLAGVEDSVDLLDTQLQTVAADMGRQIGTALYGANLGSPTAAATAFSPATDTGTPASATVVFGSGTASASNAASAFRVGETYIWNCNGAASPVQGTNNTFLLRCSAVSYTGDAGVSVTFVNDVLGFGGSNGSGAGHSNAGLALAAQSNGGVVGTSSTFHLRGSLVVTGAAAIVGPPAVAAFTPVTAATAAVSLTDVVGTGALHGLDPAAASGSGLDWTGNDVSGGVPTAELFQRGAMRIFRRAGEMPSHLAMSPSAFVIYCQAQLTPVTSTATLFGTSAVVGQARKNVDGKLDKYGRNADPSGSGVEFMGRPVIVDPNCPELQAFLINKDWIKVGEWQKLQAEDEAGSPLLLSRSQFSKSVQYSAIYNLVCRKRNAHARIGTSANPLVVL